VLEAIVGYGGTIAALTASLEDPAGMVGIAHRRVAFAGGSRSRDWRPPDCGKTTFRAVTVRP